MTQIAEIIRFYSLDEIMDFVKNGGEYPLHHVWCYDKIKESGITVDCIEYDRNSRWSKIGNKLQIFNLQQQINLLKQSKDYDVIYAPFIDDVFFLAVLKIMGLYKKPIFGLALDSHVPFKKQPLKKLRQKLQWLVYKNGIDEILFFNETIYHQSQEYGSLGKTRNYTDHWGPDLDFFKSYTERQTEPPTHDFIFSTGGTGRDYGTLANAFKEIDFKLKITTKRGEFNDDNLPPNITVDSSVTPGLHSVGILRKEYYNALAVAIPLLNIGRKWPVGITVIMEALAMAKPIISTINPSYPFHLEKEKIGFYVDYNDVEGWKQAVSHLVNNQDEAREMGERGRYLCEKKYNYKLFSKDVVSQLKKYSLAENHKKVQKAEVSAVS